MEGYDFDMAGEDFPDYKCPICLMLLRHAVILPCSHSTCKTCLEKWEKQGDSGVFLCPSCQCVYEKEKVYEGKQGHFIDRLVTTSLKVKCRQHIMGCDWAGTISDYKIHEKTCAYVLVDCEFKQCDVKVCRKDLDIHREKCSYRPIECGFCAEMIPYVQLEDHHGICDFCDVACPQFRCGKLLKRKDVPTHITNDCQYVEVPCPFQEMGCTQKVLRRDVDSHVNNSSQQHTNVLLHFTLKLTKEIKGLKEANTELRIEMEQLEESSSLRISELEEKLEQKENEINAAVNRNVDDIENKFHLETDKISEHVKLLSDKISEVEGTVHKNEKKSKDDISLVKKEIENLQAVTNVKFAASMSLSSEDRSKKWTIEDLKLIRNEEDERFAAIINGKPELAVLSDSSRSSLLHFACSHNNPSCIDVLVKNGCSVNHENNGGNKPIHWAADYGCVDAAKKLLSIDATLVNSVNRRKYTPLHCAAGNNQEEFVKYLLTQPGIQVNLKNGNNKMADEEAGTTKKIRQMIREHRNKHV